MFYLFVAFIRYNSKLTFVKSCLFICLYLIFYKPSSVRYSVYKNM